MVLNLTRLIIELYVCSQEIKLCVRLIRICFALISIHQNETHFTSIWRQHDDSGSFILQRFAFVVVVGFFLPLFVSTIVPNNNSIVRECGIIVNVCSFVRCSVQFSFHKMYKYFTGQQRAVHTVCIYSHNISTVDVCKMKNEQKKSIIQSIKIDIDNLLCAVFVFFSYNGALCY